MEREPEQARDEIREEHAEGEEPSEGERQFLEAEGLSVEEDAEHDPSDEGRGTPTY